MMLSHHLMPLETRRTTASNGTAGTWKWCFCLLKATCNFLPHPLLTWESSPTITVLKAACDYLQKPAAHCSRVLPRPPSIPSRHPGPASPQFLVSAASKWTSWHTESFAEQLRVCRGQRHKDPFQGSWASSRLCLTASLKSSPGPGLPGLVKGFLLQGNVTTQTLNQKRGEILVAINLWNKWKSWETFIAFCSFSVGKKKITRTESSRIKFGELFSYFSCFSVNKNKFLWCFAISSFCFSLCALLSLFLLC